MAKHEYNLVVIGAGSAGLVTSYVAAAAKAKVALIERHQMGGDCLNTGCVPSKALIRSASFMRDVRRCRELGFRSAEVEFDFAEVMERVQSVVRKIEPHDSVERYTELGVECISGEARIKSRHEVEVDGRLLTARSIAVCTGARPFVPPIENVKEAPHYTSDTIWSLRRKPERLVVVGGGPIGSELAQAFAYLGCKVTQVEGADHVLAREDADVSKLVMDALYDAGVRIMLNTKASACIKGEDGWKLRCESGGGGIEEVPFDALLFAVGRAPNGRSVEGIEEAGVRISERGAIEVDSHLRTSVPNIYACGDVIGSYQFTHTAGHAAFYCAINALYSPLRLKVDWSVVPWCTFTHPEVARAGLNEQDAKAAGIAYEKHVYGIDDLDRAIADQEAEGFIKILVEPGSKGKILGVTIVGHHAGDLLHEYIVAMRNGLGLDDIMRAIHIYPTLAEANKLAAGVWKKSSISPKVVAFGEWLNRSRRR